MSYFYTELNLISDDEILFSFLQESYIIDMVVSEREVVLVDCVKCEVFQTWLICSGLNAVQGSPK